MGMWLQSCKLGISYTLSALLSVFLDTRTFVQLTLEDTSQKGTRPFQILLGPERNVAQPSNLPEQSFYVTRCRVKSALTDLMELLASERRAEGSGHG